MEVFIFPFPARPIPQHQVSPFVIDSFVSLSVGLNKGTFRLALTGVLVTSSVAKITFPEQNKEEKI